VRFIHPESRIEEDTVIYPFVYIDKKVTIGRGCKIYPYAVILEGTELGRNVIIGPGSIIGFMGFGFEKREGLYKRISHKGKVVIEDDVEIGGNVTIDRATKEETRIGKGTKIDSQVHIGHNVRIGKNCIIIAQTGIGGSAKLGNGVILAGQVGIKDHTIIGDNSIVYAKSAVLKSIPEDSRFSGIPARPHLKTLRAMAKLLRGI